MTKHRTHSSRNVIKSAWLTIKRFDTGARAFESITMKAYIRDGGFKALIQKLEAATTKDGRVKY